MTKHLHLTSPECVLNFPLTSSNTPGIPLILQNGIRIAALVSLAPELFGSDLEDAIDRVFRILFNDLRVNGDVRDIKDGDVLVIVRNISPAPQLSGRPT